MNGNSLSCVLFVALIILAPAFGAGCCASDANVTFVAGPNKIDVLISKKHITSYLYSDDLTKPVLHPVRTLSGVAVTRGFPLDTSIPEESQDHPHHVGIFFTYDEVNDEGFWNNTTSPPQIKHVKVTRMEGGAGQGQLCTVMHWVDKKGNVLLEEKRDMIFAADVNEYSIDLDIDLTAQDTKVVFNDTKEGMFAIRVAHWLRETAESSWVKEATGTAEYLSSNGDRTEKHVWGKRARWVRLEGRKDGKIIGIAIFNHPDSVNYPTYWHARGYGLFSANPLGQYAFQKGLKEKNPQRFNLVLNPGETAHFGFKMIIYEGTRTKEQLEHIAAVKQATSKRT